MTALTDADIDRLLHALEGVITELSTVNARLAEIARIAGDYRNRRRLSQLGKFHPKHST